MKLLISFFIVASFAIFFATSASIPGSSDGQLLDAASKRPEGDQREGNTFPEDREDQDPFEIIVPIARNFSSLDELFQILREDDSKEPRVATGTPPTYVKGTERNSSEYLIFLTDGAGKSKGTR